jgi:hypothetical protein
MDSEVQDTESFSAWIIKQIEQLDCQIQLLTKEPNAGYLSHLCPSIFDEARGYASSLRLLNVIQILGSRPLGYQCIPREDGIVEYELFKSTLRDVCKVP